MRSASRSSISSSTSPTPTSTRASATARGRDQMATTEGTLAAPGTVVPRRSSGVWRDAVSRLRKNKLAMVGLVIVFGLFLLAIIGPILAPWPYQVQDQDAIIANGFRPIKPFSALALQTGHFMGTDELGRDLFSRLLDGAQISM